MANQTTPPDSRFSPGIAKAAPPAVMPTLESAVTPAPVYVPPPEPPAGWEMSATIGKLLLALSKAQRIMTPAKKSGLARTGPGGSREYRYSTLDDVIEAVREPLAANEIARLQTTENVGAHGVCVVTWLGHSSGEFIRSRLWMPARESVDKKTGEVFPPDTQDFGAALSYARRYALQAITGLPAEDNDAAPNEQSAPPPPRPLAIVSERSTPPLLTLEEKVIDEYTIEFARVKSHRELDGLCFEVRRKLGEKPTARAQAWFQEMRKQTEAALPPKGGAR
jgi:hypothetical protein